MPPRSSVPQIALVAAAVVIFGLVAVCLLTGMFVICSPAHPIASPALPPGTATAPPLAPSPVPLAPPPQGTSGPDKPPHSPCTGTPPLSPLSEGAILSVAPDLETGRLVPTLRTNLPAGTKAMVSLRGPFNADLRIELASCTLLEPLGPPTGLPIGSYEIRVTTLLPGLQPPTVREEIGAQGERLRGELVEASSAGRVVVSSATVDVGSQAAVDQRRHDRARLVARLRALLRRAKRVPALRADLARCGDEMRAVRAEADELVGAARTHEPALAGIAIQLRMCGVCNEAISRTACATASEDLASFLD